MANISKTLHINKNYYQNRSSIVEVMIFMPHSVYSNKNVKVFSTADKLRMKDSDNAGNQGENLAAAALYMTCTEYR